MGTVLVALAIVVVVGCGVFAWDMRAFAAITDGIERLVRRARGRDITPEEGSSVTTWSDRKTTLFALTTGSVAAIAVLVIYFLATGGLPGTS